MRAQVSGHFGEWLQGRIGPEGPVALVTLACPALGVAVRVCEGAFALKTGKELLDAERLARFLGLLDVPVTGSFAIETKMIVGAGTGASTAALVAVARAVLGGGFDPSRVAEACVAIEGASDPLMLPHPDRHVWASRQGREVLGTGALPEAEIVGGYWGKPHRTNAEDARFPDIEDLVEPWTGAVARGDLAAMAALSTESTRRTTALRGPEEDPTLQLADQIGALGVARAHTGSARAMLFDVGTVSPDAETQMRDAGYDGVFRFRTGGAA